MSTKHKVRLLVSRLIKAIAFLALIIWLGFLASTETVHCTSMIPGSGDCVPVDGIVLMLKAFAELILFVGIPYWVGYLIDPRLDKRFWRI